MSTINTQTTIEELDLICGMGLIYSADLLVDIGVDEYDPGDHDTPPCGGSAYIESFEVVSVSMYGHHAARTDDYARKIVADHLIATRWMDQPKQRDWAMQQAHDASEREYDHDLAAQEDAAESRLERQRGLA